MSNNPEMRLFSLFDQHNIAHETHEHEAIYTVAEGQDVKSNRIGGQTKNLFLKDKSGQYVLVCALSDTVIQLNQLHKILGTKRLSFGKADALYEILGVRPGSVTLFSIINDETHSVKLILDKGLYTHERVWFHPLRNTASTAIYSSDIDIFARATGHEITRVDFEAIAQSKAK